MRAVHVLMGGVALLGLYAGYRLLTNEAEASTPPEDDEAGGPHVPPADDRRNLVRGDGTAPVKHESTYRGRLDGGSPDTDLSGFTLTHATRDPNEAFALGYLPWIVDGAPPGAWFFTARWVRSDGLQPMPPHLAALYAHEG